MDREAWTRVGLGGAFCLGLIISGTAAACSSGSASNAPGRGPAGSPSNGSAGAAGSSGAFGGAGNSAGTSNNGGTAGGFFDNGGTGSQPTGIGVTTNADASSVSGPSQPANIDDCKGSGVSAAQLAMLQQGGNASNLKILYPYDGTVFPRGILAPVIQWSAGGSADAVLITMKSNKFSYQGCFGSTTMEREVLAANSQAGDDPWMAAGQWSGGTGDPTTISVTVLNGGNVIGPVTETVYFALASLTGAIYYNTYNSALTNPPNVGAVLRILPGEPNQPQPYLTDPMGGGPPTGPCISCHSLSANGAVMTANRHNYALLAETYESRSYQVNANGPMLMQNNLPESGFSGIYPDGTILMTNGLADSMSLSAWFPDEAGQPGALDATGNPQSQLIDPTSGSTIAAPGWDGTVPHATMPMFSPDGKHIVYNNYDDGKGHTLYMADFDYPTKTFSNIHKIFEDDTNYAGWPFFTPDDKLVVFSLGDQQNFVSQMPDPLLGTCCDNAAHAHLVAIDVTAQNPTPIPLDIANGYLKGQSYLPAGADRDNERDFYPTVSPVAAGGFFWVFFTSRRTYGNLTSNLMVDDPDTKAIWVTALTIGASGDTSHPAFYLPGQEFETGNMRAFASLAPCKEDGSTCMSGTECCNGFCSGIDPTTHVGTCGIRPPKTCAMEEDKCMSDSDCCPTNANGLPLICIAGFCSVVNPS